MGAIIGGELVTNGRTDELLMKGQLAVRCLITYCVFYIWYFGFISSSFFFFNF